MTSTVDGPAGDRYVTGGVNWNGYSLDSLVGMVSQQANPAQVEAVAALWSQHGAAISQSASDLGRSLTTLLSYWQGAAASQAANTVTGNVSRLAQLGTTTTQMATPIQDAAGALRSAQSTMPGASSDGFFAGFGSAASGAAIGAMMGGPFGAAAGALIGGLASAFGFGSDKDKLKQQAVQTMQRYEQAGLGIDPSTPQYAPPDATTAQAAGNTGLLNSGASAGVGTLPSDYSGPLSTSPGAGSASAGAGAGAGSAARWSALTGGPTSGIGTAALLGGGGAQSGAVAEEAEEAGFGRGGSGSVLEDAERAGTPGPYGGGRGGGRRPEEDREHRRRLSFDEDPFSTGLKVAPATIGLRSTDDDGEPTP